MNRNPPPRIAANILEVVVIVHAAQTTTSKPTPSTPEVVVVAMLLLRDNNLEIAFHAALVVDTKSSWASTPAQPQTAHASRVQQQPSKPQRQHSG